MTLDTETSGRDEFYRAVWEVVAGIPRGCVLSYGEVARLAGQPRRARMVSRALNAAPKKLRLPWHRVINAQGKISFPADSSAYQRQKALLEREGVVFLKGKVSMDEYGWDSAVDKLLWGGQD